MCIFFEKYDFQRGNYAVVGLAWRTFDHPLQEVLSDFYTDDVEVLNELKDKWITGKRAPLFACGYNYLVYVVKEGKEVESFSVNLEDGCNTVVTDKGSFWFDPENLSTFSGKLKKAVVEDRNFPSLHEARSYLKSIPKEELLMVLEPKWGDYDGEFRFEVPCDFGNLDNNLIEKCVAKTREQIAAKYPDEGFSVEQAGLSMGRNEGASATKSVLVRMKCKKPLYDAFRLFKTSSAWEDYPASLTTVWKTGHEQR